MRIQGVTMGILISPLEVIHHIVDLRQLGNSTVKSGEVAEQERELGARLAG
jgi:hypothetical protein